MEKIVRPTIRSRIRMVLSRFEYGEIIGAKRAEIEAGLLAELDNIFFPRGIDVENILLSEIQRIE